MSPPTLSPAQRALAISARPGDQLTVNRWHRDPAYLADIPDQVGILRCNFRANCATGIMFTVFAGPAGIRDLDASWFVWDTEHYTPEKTC